MSESDFAQMPSCNLAESVHNKWLQASGNKGGDLYVATVDDYIRAFLQVVAYYQFLKGGNGGDGSSKEELKPVAPNDVPSAPVILLCCRRSSWTCPEARNSPLAIHTSRAPRYLDRRSVGPILPLVQMMRHTTPTPSTFLAPVPVRDSLDLIP